MRRNSNDNNGLLTRRELAKMAAFGLIPGTLSGWFSQLATAAAADPQRKRSCILLWMSGGPSQMDTFDLKPGHANGGPFKPIDTSVPGIQISEHLPKLAQQMEHCSILRGMSTKEGDHTRATYFMHTGYLPQGPVQYPTLGSFLGKELEREAAELPNFVSIAPARFLSPAAFGPGFLGPQHAPLVVGSANLGGTADAADSLRVRNLDAAAGVTADRRDARLSLLGGLDDRFVSTHPGIPTQSHKTAYAQAVRMMRSTAVEAFNLEGEPAELRDAYGRNQFGQGCLLARRLVERGVPFVEVSLNNANGAGGIGWDTHAQNFDAVKSLSETLDPAWATLLTDLKTRGLLDSTLIVWMGEFGRTPVINANTGRDHFPGAWSTVLCGGGIRGGQVVGKTSADGMTVEERPIVVPDLLATVCQAVGVDHTRQNISNVGRPIRLADAGSKPIAEVLLQSTAATTA